MGGGSDRCGGPNAAEGIRVPGNHDWGQKTGADGIRRLAETEAVIDRWAASGVPAFLLPRGVDSFRIVHRAPLDRPH